MNKINCKKIFKNCADTFVKYSPQILTTFGICGMITAVGLGIKATPKAMKKKDILESKNDNPTKMDYIKEIGPVYIPTVLTIAASTACIIGGFGISEKRTAALATAYKLSETAFKEYKDATIETIGKKKEAEIKERIVENDVNNHPIEDYEIISTGHGETLFRDMASGRYFKSDIEFIRSCINDFNAFLMADNSRDLNDFYDQIDLERTELGNLIAWTYYGDGSMKESFLDIEFIPVLKDGKVPCIGMKYDLPYRYGFERFC